MSFEALHNLKKLFQEGFIDEQEFAFRKRQIIDTLTHTSLIAAEQENQINIELGNLTHGSDQEGEVVEDEDDDSDAPKRKFRIIESSSPTHSPPMVPRRKRKLSEKKLTISDEEEPDPSDPNATYTWSELIEKALSVLGASRTGHEITEYIEENYPHILTNKTKTWKNSVFGCLSSNARKRWIKEQTVVNGKKRFVWRLNKTGEYTNKTEQGQQHLHYHNTTIITDHQLGSPFAAKALSKMRKINPPKQLNFAETPIPSGTLPVQQSPLSSPGKASLLILSNLASFPVPAEPVIPHKKEEEDIVEEFQIHELDERQREENLHHDMETSDVSNETAKLVEQSLKSLGGRATGQEIADYILAHYDVGNMNKRSLRYSVNAILSSKKHSAVFVKDQTGEKTLWQLSELTRQ